MLQQLSQIQQIQQQNSGGIELQHHFTGAIVIVLAAVPSSSNGSNEADRSTAAPIIDPPANQEIPCPCIEFTSDRICNFIGIDFSGGSRHNSSNA